MGSFEELDSDVPLPGLPQKVGIIFNLKKGLHSDVPDEEAEYDNISTVYSISNALKKHGIESVMIEEDLNIFENLKKLKPDFIFNIAEGNGGRGREAQVPAMLNLFGIPYTGSDETTLAVSMDKALTKRLLSTYSIPTPAYQVVSGESAVDYSAVKYPAIVKPNCEGSSKGVSDVSVAVCEEDLKSLLKKNFKMYGGTMLIEQFIHGREFTVGLLGNGQNVRVFRPMEIVYKQPTQGEFCVYSYQVKQQYTKFVKYECPSSLPEKTEKEMMRLSKEVFLALGCKDFSRIDFRVEGNDIYFIEINPLPGLAPNYSDYPMLAEFCGMEYDNLVFNILKNACERYALRG